MPKSKKMKELCRLVKITENGVVRIMSEQKYLAEMKREKIMAQQEQAV